MRILTFAMGIMCTGFGSIANFYCITWSTISIQVNASWPMVNQCFQRTTNQSLLTEILLHLGVLHTVPVSCENNKNSVVCETRENFVARNSARFCVYKKTAPSGTCFYVQFCAQIEKIICFCDNFCLFVSLLCPIC